MVGAHRNLNGLRDLTTPLSETFAIHGLALATINLGLSTKFEVSNSTLYKDTKGDTIAKMGWFGIVKVTQGHGK